VIEMKSSTEKFGIQPVDLIYFAIGIILLLLVWGVVANGQTETKAMKAARGDLQVQQPIYKEYRGVRLGMTAAEARAKLGEPTMKSDEQDFYIVSPSETAQIVYTAQKVVTISIDYTGEVGAPDYKSVVGDSLQQRADGSLFKMVLYDSEHLWVSYNKSATVVPVVTITIGTQR
jgi:hypothetical protein